VIEVIAMWIVFGVNELQKEHGVAPRYCLRCKKVQSHGLVSVQAWFALFFIPVLPLAPRSFMVRCGLCGHHLPEQSRPTPRWTLAPRHKAARGWGWLFTILGSLWASLMIVVYVTSAFSDKPMPIEGVLCGVGMALPFLGLGLLAFRTAARLNRAMAEPETKEERVAQEPPAVVTKCPRCAEEVAIEAKVCRHCRHEFDEAAVARARKRADSQMKAYTSRLERQAQLAELNRQRVGYLVVAWITLVTCLLIWLSPVFFLKAHRLKQQIRELEADGSTEGAKAPQFG